MSTSQSPFREPTSYASEPQEPHVPEMELVNDFARFFAKKGEILSLDPAMKKYVEMHIAMMRVVAMNVRTTDDLRGELEKAEAFLEANFEKVTGLKLGQPVVLEDQSAFVAVPRDNEDNGQWKRVPSGWQLNGVIGYPTTILNSGPINPQTMTSKISLHPAIYIEDPFFLTDTVERFDDFSERFVIKAHVSDPHTTILEGVFFEPSMRDDEEF